MLLTAGFSVRGVFLQSASAGVVIVLMRVQAFISPHSGINVIHDT